MEVRLWALNWKQKLTRPCRIWQALAGDVNTVLNDKWIYNISYGYGKYKQTQAHLSASSALLHTIDMESTG